MVGFFKHKDIEINSKILCPCASVFNYLRVFVFKINDVHI